NRKDAYKRLVFPVSVRPFDRGEGGTVLPEVGFWHQGILEGIITDPFAAWQGGFDRPLPAGDEQRVRCFGRDRRGLPAAAPNALISGVKFLRRAGLQVNGTVVQRRGTVAGNRERMGQQFAVKQPVAVHVLRVKAGGQRDRQDRKS